jgi:hypothetical protein
MERKMSSPIAEWSVKELVELLKQTAELDKDNLVPVDGGTGTGKSTLALKMCRKGCDWFDMEKDILYSRQEIMEWISSAKPGSWGLADEAVNALFKRDFGTKDQKFLLKLLDMCRSRNLTLLLCIPNFWALDSHILQGRVRLRIHVFKTGAAYLWKPSGNPFAPDKWFRKYNEKVCWGWDKSHNVVRTKGFVGMVQFGDLTPEIKNQYNIIKEEKKRMIKEQEEMASAKESEAERKASEFKAMEIIYWLNKKLKLRPGWIQILATLEGIGYEAMKTRIRDFAQRYLKAGEGDENHALRLESAGEDKHIINTSNNQDDLMESPQQDNIVQYDEQQSKGDEMDG